MFKALWGADFRLQKPNAALDATPRLRRRTTALTPRVQHPELAARLATVPVPNTSRP